MESTFVEVDSGSDSVSGMGLHQKTAKRHPALEGRAAGETDLIDGVVSLE